MCTMYTVHIVNQSIGIEDVKLQNWTTSQFIALYFAIIDNFHHVCMSQSMEDEDTFFKSFAFAFILNYR